VARAFEPLKKVAASGVPVYVVPGNHERSRIPYGLLAQHENLFLFDRPKTYVWRQGSFTLALDARGALAGWRFHELPEDAVVQARVEGTFIPPVLGAASLRALAPPTMNFALSLAQSRRKTTPPFITKKTFRSAATS